MSSELSFTGAMVSSMSDVSNMTRKPLTEKELKYLYQCEMSAKMYSTCGKRQYFAIVLDSNGHIVGTGYNGGPSGTKHCNEGGCPRLAQGSAPGSNYDNCLSGDTRYLTRFGTKSLKETVDTEQLVLTSMGWKPATIRSFGERELFDVVLRRHKQRKIVKATTNHRWFTYDSHRVTHELTTEQLVKGHCLKSAYARTGPFMPSTEGQKAGLVFGDGSCVYSQAGSGSFIQLYGPAVQLSYLFGAEGYDGVKFSNLPRLWKTEYPSLQESFGYLYGWLQGYFAADGCLSHSTPVLDSSVRENLEYVQEICYVLGIPTLGINHTKRLGYGSEPSSMYRLSFPQGSLDHDFFLLNHHREKSVERSRKRDMPRWTVESVVSVGVEETYCAQVPDLEEFTLTDNILTGNCIAIHAEANALLHSDYSDRRDGRGTIFVNGTPCYSCAKLIANSYLERIVCISDSTYEDWPRVRGELEDWGIDVCEVPRSLLDRVKPIM